MHAAMEDGGNGIEEDDMTTNRMESAAGQTNDRADGHGDTDSAERVLEERNVENRCRHGEGEGSVPSADRAA